MYSGPAQFISNQASGLRLSLKEIQRKLCLSKRDQIGAQNGAQMKPRMELRIQLRVVLSMEV